MSPTRQDAADVREARTMPMARMAATIRPVNQTLLMKGLLLITLACRHKKQASSITISHQSLLEPDIETASNGHHQFLFGYLTEITFFFGNTFQKRKKMEKMDTIRHPFGKSDLFVY